MIMKPRIIYVYDALCAWCYAFSPVIKAVHEYYSADFDFEVISGGMVMGERIGPINKLSDFSGDLFKSVEAHTGIIFGTAFLQQLAAGEMIFTSEVPAVALCVFKTLEPSRAVEFAHDLQNSIYFDGKEPADIDLYRYLAVNFSIDPDEFEGRMNDPDLKEAARYDFALAKQLEASVYPSVFIQQTESKFYLVARGYANYETMELRINNVKEEMRYYS
jgi:putative protein-disulfide isomerase